MKGDYFFMKDRLAPCIYYICKGECTKGRNAKQKKLCQTCDKYKARKGFKVVNKKKENKYKYYE